jgi:hypothetical protein
MEGMPNHSKDALEFLLHDLKHMENFIDHATYKEQVGFFRCMLKLSDVKGDEKGDVKSDVKVDVKGDLKTEVVTSFDNNGGITSLPIGEIEPHIIELEAVKSNRSPQPFFVDVCGYDKHLWRELEYVISDMNCYSTHMMQYMLAKMIIATERLLDGKLS